MHTHMCVQTQKLIEVYLYNIDSVCGCVCTQYVCTQVHQLVQSQRMDRAMLCASVDNLLPFFLSHFTSFSLSLYPFIHFSTENLLFQTFLLLHSMLIWPIYFSVLHVTCTQQDTSLQNRQHKQHPESKITLSS